MTTGLPVFDKTVQETNLWLKAVEQELEPCDRRQAYDVLRAVLHALRDRLQPESALHFAAQLPLLLRGVFTEGWQMSKTPASESTPIELARRVSRGLPATFPIDGERSIRAVFKVISDKMGPAMVSKIEGELPQTMRGLWPEKAGV